MPHAMRVRYSLEVKALYLDSIPNGGERTSYCHTAGERLLLQKPVKAAAPLFLFAVNYAIAVHHLFESELSVFDISDLEVIKMYFDVKASGERIKNVRKFQNMTQEQFADALKVSCNYISKVENGSYGCSIDILASISILFNVSLDYLILGKLPSNEGVKVQLQSIISDLVKLESLIQ